MVVGALPTLGDAEVCLGNLAEAGFAAGTVSVVAAGPGQARALARTGGPLHGLPPGEAWPRLRALGVPADTVDRCRRVVAAGGALLVLAVPAGLDAAAAEMLRDHDAAEVAVIPADPPATARRPRS